MAKGKGSEGPWHRLDGFGNVDLHFVACLLSPLPRKLQMHQIQQEQVEHPTELKLLQHHPIHADPNSHSHSSSYITMNHPKSQIVVALAETSVTTHRKSTYCKKAHHVKLKSLSFMTLSHERKMQNASSSMSLCLRLGFFSCQEEKSFKKQICQKHYCRKNDNQSISPSFESILLVQVGKLFKKFVLYWGLWICSNLKENPKTLKENCYGREKKKLLDKS